MATLNVLSSTRSIHRWLGRLAKPPFLIRPRILLRKFSATPGLENTGREPPTAARPPPSPHHHSPPTAANQRLHLSSGQAIIENRRRDILSHALGRVHDDGWTDDAVASGTLDAGLPPSYVGRALSASSAFGCADLVAFFMDECNSELRRLLVEDFRERGEKNAGDDDAASESVSSRIHGALKTRLSMVLPFVTSGRWHEGMAVGALPQNAYRTARQLDEMASIVLNFALGEEDAGENGPVQRAGVVAAYAAAELHLLSDVKDDKKSGGFLPLSGERYHATWLFLEARSAEAAHLIVEGPNMPLPLPDHARVMAALVAASSFAGASLSLAAPSAAAVAGRVLPLAMSSLLLPSQNLSGSQTNAQRGDGTKPSDYALDADALPPFNVSEVFFSENDRKFS